MPKQNIQPNRPTENSPQRRLPRKQPTDIKNSDKEKNKRRNTFITVIAIFVVISLVIGIGYYLIYVMPFQRTIIKVDNESIKINYLLKRALNMSSDDPIGQGLFETLVNEIIVSQEAPKYGINVTEADIDTTLHDAAKGESESITDAEYDAWYRQLLNNTQYSVKQLRDLVKSSIEQQRMVQYFADNTPTVAEQGYLWVIVVKTYEEAFAAKERIDNGEQFTNIAREISLDSTTNDNGGEIGWVPFKAMESRFEYTLAGLDIGKCSDPVINETGDASNPESMNYAIFMISEKESAREVTEDYLATLKTRAFADWLNSQWDIREIKYYSIHGGNYDDVTSAWLNYQLNRMKAGTTSGTEDTTSTSTQQQ